MFGKKKKKKDKNLNSNQEVQETSKKPNEASEIPDDKSKNQVQEPEAEQELTESQKQKLQQLDSVKSKISKILKSGNIEIIDENAGDEYDDEEVSDTSDKKKQQDYDSLKAVFGGKNKNKKQELTLTIDDFDYTYVGKYVEEYDLIHRKNIKKIKLPNKALKIVKKVAIIVVLIGALIGGIVFAINFTKEPAYFLDKVTLSRETQTYFTNESFDFTGLYLQLTYTNGKSSYSQQTPLKIDYFSQANSKGNFNAGRNTITFTGGSEVTLGFIYGGKLCNMLISIQNKNSTGLTVKYTNGMFDLEAGSVITSKNLFALVNYENYNSELLNLNSLSLKVDGVTQIYDSEKEGFVLSRATTHSSVIEVSANANSRYKVELKYQEDAKGIIIEEYKAS